MTKEAVGGLSTKAVSALRYDSRDADPYESTGLIISLIERNSRVLDIGCGTGSISSLIIEMKDVSLVGIEPNAERANKAIDNGITVLHGVFSEKVLETYGKFDYVLFADVLEHLVDPLEILTQVKSVLSPNGRVLASIPNVAHWTVRLKLLAGMFDYTPTGIMDATHLRWFTRRSVRRLFDEAGYDIEVFKGAAGGWLGVYRYTPLGFLSKGARSRVLSKMCKVMPGLFSVQHVVSAKPRS